MPKIEAAVPAITPSAPPETTKPAVGYPLSLLRPDAGQLINRYAANEGEEKTLRSQGFKTAEELWP